VTKRERLTFLFLWATLGFLPLLLRPLWEPDEARYAEIPREMLEKGDWLTPTLNYVPYFEKPPLQYWLSALSMKLFGLNAVAARLPLALASALALWCAWRLARRLGARDPRWAMVMTATGLLAFVTGQVLLLDGLFAALVVLCLTAALEAVAARFEDRPALAWTLLAHGALAAAMLTKGLAGPVLAGGTVILSLGLTRNEPRLRSAVLGVLFHPLGLLLLVGLAAPWFVWVNRVNPGHAQYFFVHEHFARFSSHVHERQGSENGLLDKLYFVGILLVGLLPWLSASLIGLKRGWVFIRSAATGPRAPAAPLHRWVVGTLLLALAWPLFFFTFSGSKLPPYILPVIVPLMALACALEREGEELAATRRHGWELLLLGGLFLVGSSAFARGFSGDPGWGWALGLAFALYGAWCLRPRGLTSARMLAAHAACLLLFSTAAHQLASRGKDVGPLVAMAPRNTQWISLDVFFRGLPFHARQRVTVVNGTGELAFGKGQLSLAEQERWFPEGVASLVPTALRLRETAPQRPVYVLARAGNWKHLSDSQRGAFVLEGTSPGLVLARLR
jgi:4-amino-4-deoxy-L-arabinose transferase-like glycosyltransferase